MASLERRAFLAGLGAGAGLLLSRLGGAFPRWLGGEPLANLDQATALRALHASLSDAQRRLLCLPWDHPSRQVTQTVALLDRPHLATLLNGAQRQLVDRIYQTFTSETGRRALAGTVGLEGKLDGCVLAFYGEPEEAAGFGAMINGGHLLLRGGGLGDVAAFGGPIAWGQQIGNGRFRLEGSALAYQGDALNRLYEALSEDERAAARIDVSPHELMVQPQGRGGRFPGLSLAAAGDAARDAGEALLDALLSVFAEPQARAARASMAENGGLEALHLEVYESGGQYEDGGIYAEESPAERASRGLPYWHVWRLEGPGTAIHFRGWPHLHAYASFVRDPSKLGIGETLAHTPRLLEGAPVVALLERALRRASGEALAFHPDDLAARLCPGAITTGMAWTLDPFGNRVSVASIRTEAMAEPLRTSLAQRGVELAPSASMRIATVEYFAGREDLFGVPDEVETGSVLVRDAVIELLRAEGAAALG